MPGFARSLRPRSRFALIATAGYAGLVLIASLYPFEGWRVPDVSRLWAQLSEWPRYYTYSDVAFNVAAYVPLGVLVALWLRPRLGRFRATAAAIAVTTLLSSALEVLQAGIATRVPSGLDVFCNALGGWAGAWGVLATSSAALRSGTLVTWRQRHVLPGGLGDASLVLLLLWLVTQFRPDFWLFGSGDVRTLLPALPGEFSARSNIALEAVVAAAGLVVLAGLVRSAVLHRPLAVFLAVALATLGVRCAAAAYLEAAGDALLWTTPGNALGTIVGLAAGALTQRLGARGALLAAAAGVVAGGLALNGAPPNPYFDVAAIADWRQSHLRSLAGTSRVVQALWPALAAAYMLAWLRNRGAQPDRHLPRRGAATRRPPG